MTQKSTPRVDYALLKRVVSLSMILSRYGVLEGMRRSGSQLKSACPIHHGTNKRQFVVNLQDNTWHCFGDCQQGGSTFELVAAIERIPIHEAAVRIAEWFAIPLPHTQAPERKPAMSGNQQPSHKVYTVEDRNTGDDEADGFWTRIGSAWPHKDGKGLNVVLSALPLTGRLVLREYTEKDAKEDDEKRKTSTGKKK